MEGFQNGEAELHPSSAGRFSCPGQYWSPHPWKYSKTIYDIQEIWKLVWQLIFNLSNS